MSIFSERIKLLKSNKNSFQKDISKAIGVSLRAYQYYETDQREPTLSVLVALADYFNVSLDYLTGRTDEPVNLQNIVGESDKSINYNSSLNYDCKENIIKPSHTNEEEELLENFKLLDKHEKRIIKGRIAEMLYNKEIEKNSSESEFSVELVNTEYKDKVNK